MVAEVYLNNRWAWFASQRAADKARRFLRHRVPNYEHMEKYRNGDWDGYVTWIRKDRRVPTGVYLMRKAAMESRAGLVFQEILEWERPAYHAIFTPRVTIERRPYHRKALERMLTAPACGGIVLQATGTGKTILAADYFAHLKGSGVFVVDELTLLKQSRKAIARVTGEPVGIVGESKFLPERLTCATVQTLQIHAKDKDFRRWFRALDTAIFDEIHLAINNRTRKVLTAMRPRCVFGLTGTLQWEKAAIRYPAAALCGPVLYRYPLKQGVEEGYLSNGVACCVHHIDQRPTARTYRLAYETHIIDCPKRNKLIVSIVREAVRRGKRVVLIVERVPHLENLHHDLRDIKHALAYGKIPVSERERAQAEMNAGTLPLIICNRVFGKGIDLTRLDLIVDGCASRKADSTLQRYGRGTRTHEDKQGLIFIDIFDRGIDNRFHDAALARRKALRKSDIRVINIKDTTDAKVILDRAERELARVLKEGT